MCEGELDTLKNKLKWAQQSQRLAVCILALLNRQTAASDAIREIVRSVQELTGFEAVGIRLRDGEDFPYFETKGFPSYFVEMERSLYTRTEEGEILRDPSGNPILECMCGNILQERADPSFPFFTQRGSFWTNSTTELLATPTEVEREARARNRCNGEGYESVALIPLRSERQVIGLLQLNDSRKNCFTPEMIDFFEGIGVSIGIVLERKRVEEERDRLFNLSMDMLRVAGFDHAAALKKVNEALFREMSERKRAEEALELEREQLLSIFDSISEVIVVIDPRDHEILYTNKFTKNLYGKELVGGQCFKELGGRDSQCGHCMSETIMKLEGKPHQWEYHNSMVHRDYLATDRMIKWTDGRDVRFQFAIDITERKRAEQNKENLSSQLLHAQKMEAIGTLAGGIAHDFNNLLTVILGFSELLIAGKDEGDSSHADLQKIHQAARNGADLVQRMLAFSRKTEINPRPLNLNREIEQFKTLVTRAIPRMIQVELVLSGDIGTVNADAAQVEQVLMSLAVNAKEAMSDGGTLTIETQNVTLDEEYCRMHVGAKPGDYVLLSVSDTGNGMDPELLSHIFEPFYTTKEMGRGTGLGLAIVYGIVKQHGGYITCQSALGAGTTFKIYVPVIPGESRSETSTGKPVLPKGTETILLVDDEEPIRDLGKRILERSGYTVLTAANGKDALNLYRKEKNSISLVILDLNMPEMDGKQCLEELLEIDPRQKVLVASGYSRSGETKKVIEAGARGFVAKPYGMKQMLPTVRKALDED